ncbi:MAG: hypothetical protein UV59_C0050G0007 [Candidatus Gottesmanbacteria bacterium GW2011_GWA1_43_11]|uniref:Mannosyl-glycoprotein endo-beta-N-acetylglucosamidase-like domain-containing protein n=1 Tax=Candidatus Gottesmanbacteria bacterium GW2011_GWA1_43_11 TaxID=1618436 RepID=A0A0G1CBY4_9BACT|nr:MAG: hypothetical protein UV59_C0050G0007 [Candidatus Gottesmanbacteria bacterium GW2011_GWA1_43_11]
MKRIVLFSFIVLLVLTFVSPVIALEAGTSAAIKISYTQTDQRIIKLQSYLESHNSPLADYAEVFIDTSDKYGLFDWKLVPAITGVESTFGKAIPYNSYNAYGWVNGNYAFESWEESIDIVTKTLKTKYMDRGLDSVDKIAPVYAPPSTTWAGKVKFFMEKIENYLPEHTRELSITL